MATDTQGKILTVTGPIEPADLGKTLIHEHLFFDLSCYFRPPEDERGKSLADEPLQLSNLAWVRQNIMSSRPNLVMDDAGVVEAEVGKFQNLGGSALVDLATYGGYGYGHVLENIVPLLKARAVSDDDLDKILVENPRRFLTMQ